MPRVSQIINSFGAGEFAPELDGRTDIVKRKSGAKKIENFIVHPEGGAHRRPGTRFVQAAADSTKKSRLIPFIFSTTQAYVLEFSEFLIRVFASELQIDVEEHDLDSPDTTTDEFTFTDHGYVDQQGPFVITATAGIPAGLTEDSQDYFISMPKTLTFVDGDVSIAGDTITFGFAHEYSVNQGPFLLSTVGGALPEGLNSSQQYFILVSSSTVIQLEATIGGGAINILTLYGGTHTLAPQGDYLRDSFRLATSAGGAPIDITTAGTGPHTFTPNPAGTPTGLPLEIPTPYTEAQLYGLQYAQSADFLFISHKDHRPAQLTRSGTTKWAFNFMSIVDGPLLAENTDATITVNPGSTSVGLTVLTYVGATWSNDDIGRIIRIRHGSSDVGYAEIDGIRSSTVATADVKVALASSAATSTFSLGYWYNGNWPNAISFFEQRLALDGELASPEVLHGSQTSGFNSFASTEADSTVVDSNAVNFVMGMNEVNNIRWMGVSSRLVIGTANALFTARGTFDGDPITPTSIQVQRITAVGASAVQPVNISDQLVYVTANNQSLRGVVLSANADTVVPTDITLLAKHIFGRTLTITTMGFQQDRQQVLWCVRSDGVIAAVTYVPDQQVFAWHRHILGGSFGSGAAVVESVAVIPSPGETHDQVWLSVKRTVNSATVRHIEFFEDEWLDDVNTSMRYVDSAPVAYSGVAKSTFEGLGHLEGETVQVFADGALHPDRTVSSGAITLDASYTDVLVGLQYISELETLSLDFPDPEGSSMGKVGRIDHLVLRAYNTIGGEVGPDTDHLDPIQWSDTPLVMGAPPVAFTGDKKIAFDGGYQREKRLVVRQDKPLPFNLLSINVLGKSASK